MSNQNQLIHVEYNLKLDVCNMILETINKWSNESKFNSIEIKVYNKIPEALLNEYCTKLSCIENSMPDEPGNEEVKVDDEEIKKETNIISYILFKDNEIIGISRLFINPDDKLSIYQGQIGIIDRFQGEGYAKYLISKSYSDYIKNNSSLKSITVDTHPSNKVMIYLLEELGFKYTHTDRIYK